MIGKEFSKEETQMFKKYLKRSSGKSNKNPLEISSQLSQNNDNPVNKCATPIRNETKYNHYLSAWWLIKKIKIELSYDTAIPHKSKYSTYFTAYHRDTCVSIFLATFIQKQRKWNQSIYASVDTWI